MISHKLYRNMLSFQIFPNVNARCMTQTVFNVWHSTPVLCLQSLHKKLCEQTALRGKRNLFYPKWNTKNMNDFIHVSVVRINVRISELISQEMSQNFIYTQILIFLWFNLLLMCSENVKAVKIPTSKKTSQAQCTYSIRLYYVSQNLPFTCQNRRLNFCVEKT